MSNARILMVSDVHFPRVNGVSTSIDTFRAALPTHNIQVNLVAPRYGQEQDDVLRVASRAVPRDPEDRLMHWRAAHKTVLQAATDCDLIHIQTPFVAHAAGVKCARALGLPVIATYHTLFEEYLHHYAPFAPAQWLQKLARYVSRRQCNSLDAVIVPSQAMRQRLTQYGVTTPMHVLPTGIPLHRFRSGDGASFRKQWGIAPQQPVALYVGRVAFEKNIEFLLEMLALAVRSHPDVLLLITGDGPALPSLRQQAQDLGLNNNVRFLGYLDRNSELQNCYAAANVFVFASRTETQGLVLLEAMAMGLPVVALAAMGTGDILEQGQGCVVPRDDVQEFAQATLNLLHDPARCQRLAQEARRYAQLWSDQVMAAQLAQLYQSLLSQTWKVPTKARPAYAE